MHNQFKHLKNAEQGAKVVIIGRNESTLRESAVQNENIHYRVTDLSVSSQLTQLVEQVKNDFGKLDVLVNNAGWAPITPLGKIQMKEYEAAFDTNVRGVLDLTQQALPLLKESKGNIINISSTVARQPLANMSVYSASKAALKAMTKSWSKELAQVGIRVNAVTVGPIETPIYDKTDLTPEEAKAHHDNVEKMIPLGYFGQPEDVAYPVLFFASDKSRFITGADLAVDGGMLA
ncbi:SDR family oxidoreductase [Bacillus sp. ISL-18]|uniref:SDR family NAD(P)-dependent oxidoreductase n=1 Tax=Bacillus sp. ISL-18 TaxID=2819118 RepID=UPI001BEC0B1C|nr:SDR family oxidoreductase [Bacillus sp. ISL-18]MBT2658378.1 SDR family oxidoreductase [Bacillus sp. ISL-18]